MVIYLEKEVESDSQRPAKVRIGGKWYVSCLYEWSRGKAVDKGAGDKMEEGE